MSGYLLGLYEKSMPASLSWEEKFISARESCYDYLELSIDETPEKLSRLDMPVNERIALLETAYKCGIYPGSICLSGHRKYSLGSKDPAIRARSLEIMEKTLVLACDLGVRTIQLAGYDVYYEESDIETAEFFEESLCICVAMASKYGVSLGFETMETEFMNTVGKAMKYVSLINSPYLGVYPDCGNITNSAVNYGTSVTDDLDTGRGHILAVHLKETVPGKFREIPYGTGHVDFKAVIDKSRELGVRRYVAEFWYTGEKNWKDILKNNNAFIRKFFE